jgi:hypothetical protein
MLHIGSTPARRNSSLVAVPCRSEAVPHFRPDPLMLSALRPFPNGQDDRPAGAEERRLSPPVDEGCSHNIDG